MSTDPPQQRQYPGEVAGKCNPERDAKPPLFPNQADPPPERPWPATAWEGNSTPRPTAHHPADERSDDAEQHPWNILVAGGRVIGRYRAEDAYREGIDVTRMRLDDVAVYEINAREDQMPGVGETVDPTVLGWVKVG